MTGTRSPRFPPTTHLLRRRIGLVLLLGSAWLLSGCSAPPEVPPGAGTDPIALVPPDFQLDVQVLAGSKVDDRDRLERRTTHIVVLPDGSLHAAVGADVRPGSRPGLARVLYRDQVAEVWALLGQLSIIGAGKPVSGPVRSPGAKELVYIVEYTMNNERLRIVQRVLSPDAKEDATTVLVRTLGALAWLRDTPLQDSTVAPLRYDFGPDPWARYRTIDEGG